MKCIPITWWALSGITPAIFDIDIDEVFEAKTACLGVCLAKSSNILAFNTKSSFTASIAKSISLRCWIESTYSIFERTTFF